MSVWNIKIVQQGNNSGFRDTSLPRDTCFFCRLHYFLVFVVVNANLNARMSENWNLRLFFFHDLDVRNQT